MYIWFRVPAKCYIGVLHTPKHLSGIDSNSFDQIRKYEYLNLFPIPHPLKVSLTIRNLDLKC